MKWLTRILTLLAFFSLFLTVAFFGLGPQWVDRASNRVVGEPGPDWILDVPCGNSTGMRTERSLIIRINSCQSRSFHSERLAGPGNCVFGSQPEEGPRKNGLWIEKKTLSIQLKLDLNASGTRLEISSRLLRRPLVRLPNPLG